MICFLSFFLAFFFISRDSHVASYLTTFFFLFWFLIFFGGMVWCVRRRGECIRAFVVLSVFPKVCGSAVCYGLYVCACMCA